MKGVKKDKFCEQHNKCKEAHVKKVDELWEKYKDDSTESPLPTAEGPVKERIVYIQSPSNDEAYQAAFYKLLTEAIRLQKEVDGEDYLGDEMSFQQQVADLLGPTHYKVLKDKLSFDKLEAAHMKFFPDMPHDLRESDLRR